MRPSQHGDIVFPGNGYPPLALFQIPHAEHLIGAFFFGEGRDLAGNDWSGNGGDVKFAGDPDFSSGYGKFGGTNFGVTGVDETLEATLLVIFRENSAARVGVYGNYGGSASVGLSIYVQNDSASVSLNTGREGNTGGVVSIGGSAENWIMVSAQVPVTGQARLKNHVSGAASTSGSALDRIANGLGPMRIGEFEAANFNGDSDQFVILHYDIALTNEQTDEVATALRALASNYNISV